MAMPLILRVLASLAAIVGAVAGVFRLGVSLGGCGGNGRFGEIKGWQGKRCGGADRS